MQPFDPRLQPFGLRLQPFGPKLQPFDSRLQPFPFEACQHHTNDVFESANVSSVIYLFRNEQLKDYSFEYIKADNVTQWKAGEGETIVVRKSVVEKAEFYKVCFSSEVETDLLIKINNTDKLSSIMKVWRGEEIGRKSSLISFYPTTNDRPLLAGDNVHRYEPITWNRYIDIDDVGKGNYEKPKILIRQLGSCINATLDLDGCVTLQSIYNLALQKGNVQTLKYVLGLLNSKLYDFIYNKISGDKQTFQRIILENVKQLPVPTATPAQQQPIIALVDKILAAKKTNSQADTGAWEREIDGLVYELYGLTEDEVKVVERGA